MIQWLQIGLMMQSLILLRERSGVYRRPTNNLSHVREKIGQGLVCIHWSILSIVPLTSIGKLGPPVGNENHIKE